MLEVDGPWPPVEPEPVPVPQLEREDVRRRADLEHHPVAAAAMHRAGRNEEVVVPPRGPYVDMTIGWKRRAASLCRAQIRGHQLAINTLANSEIDDSVIVGVEEVVGLVLRERQPEVLPDVVGQ